MTPEEKTPEHADSESLQSSVGDSSPAARNSTSAAETEAVDARLVEQFQPVEASLAEPEIVESDDFTELGTTMNPAGVALVPPPPIASNMENIAANGGAIGALVLGIWCVIGSFITNWSIINGVLGLLMGIWGLASRKRRTAWIGIALCILGFFMSLVQVSEMVNTYLNAVDESQF